MNKNRLDVLICTFGRKGIDKVVEMNLPSVPGVRYIVSWQTNSCDPKHDIPAKLLREDILISPTDSIGSSNNRNHAIHVSTAPICLTADDDLAYSADQLQAVIDTFEKNPDIDLASFKYSGPDNKPYPREETDLKNPLPKGFYSTSFEVAFRRASVKDKIFYNPYFGINSPKLVCGDDNVFLLDCINAGLRCRFFPIVITHHKDLSSGSRLFKDPGFLMTQGAYIRYAYGWKGAPRVPLYVWRQFRKYNLGIVKGLKYLIAGFLYKVPKGATHL